MKTEAGYNFTTYKTFARLYSERYVQLLASQERQGRVRGGTTAIAKEV